MKGMAYGTFRASWSFRRAPAAADPLRSRSRPGRWSSPAVGTLPVQIVIQTIICVRFCVLLFQLEGGHPQQMESCG